MSTRGWYATYVVERESSRAGASASAVSLKLITLRIYALSGPGSRRRRPVDPV